MYSEFFSPYPLKDAHKALHVKIFPLILLFEKHSWATLTAVVQYSGAFFLLAPGLFSGYCHSIVRNLELVEKWIGLSETWIVFELYGMSYLGGRSRFTSWSSPIGESPHALLTCFTVSFLSHFYLSLVLSQIIGISFRYQSQSRARLSACLGVQTKPICPHVFGVNSICFFFRGIFFQVKGLNLKWLMTRFIFGEQFGRKCVLQIVATWIR